MAMRDFEAAQAEAMELLLQQCVDGGGDDLQATAPRGSAASLMDTLARTCEDAGAAVGDMSYEDVAASLAHAVAATRESLRNVRENVGAILDDPDKMRRLCENLQSADHPLLLGDDADSDSDGGRTPHAAASPPSSSTTAALAIASPPQNEENVRHMMAFAENMCGVLDDALGTISDDELALTAQLSLGLAQKVLEAGQALFVSLGDDEREKLREHQAARITVEELPSGDDGDDDNEDAPARRRAARRAQAKQQRRLKHSAALRTYLEHLAVRTRAQASEHPYMAGALTAMSLPFVGFAPRRRGAHDRDILPGARVGDRRDVRQLCADGAALDPAAQDQRAAARSRRARVLQVVARVCVGPRLRRHWRRARVGVGQRRLTLRLPRVPQCGLVCAGVLTSWNVMGGRHSKQLKKELAELKSQVTLATQKHAEELEAAKRDKRELEFKLGVLQELAQLAAEKAGEAALESEERVKALKWELVRKLTVSSSSTTFTGSSSQPAALSLARAESSSPRVVLNWKLRDDVTLRRSSITTLPRSALDSAAASKKQPPHAQSEPAMPQKQVHSSHRDSKTNSSQSGSEPTHSDSRARAMKVGRSNIEHKEEVKGLEPTAETVPVAAQSSSSPSSSENYKPASKYPALSRTKSARAPTPAQAHNKSRGPASDQSEPESEGSARVARARKHPEAHTTDGDAKQEESEREDSERQASGRTSVNSRDDEEVLAFTNAEDDSS
ncbi:hypothetical protein PybrP1_012943 [[Pythium] brassicae (nom. inval.)]|nr:hypothetical protein PybrP1_012943 [[Pythium] brassicae (nom. inval.)]